MFSTGTRKWHRGELYELLCLLGIGECIWLAGNTLGVFPLISRTVIDSRFSSLLYLGFLMSFFLAIGSVRKSLQLRREMKARATAELEAHSLARHDALTGLPNRRLLAEAINKAAQTRNEAWAVLVIDLDRFKLVNDAFGHEAGDHVLCEVATRLQSLCPRGGAPARLGGDEFALLMPYSSQGDLVYLAEQIVKELRKPVEYKHAVFNIGACIGIAQFPQDGCESEALLRCADIAMYRGKREGGGVYRFFESEMDEEIKTRASLETGLLTAIVNGDIRPHYQPLVSMPGNVVLGFEVLARWYHPQKGILPPDSFIPLAEQTGLIGELSYAILRQACYDARAWPEHLKLAVNISPCQFSDAGLAVRLLGILSAAGFPPRRLEVEITESALTNDMERARKTLQALQAAGISIALDDFGTGYSSLGHLRELNFDRIKIDRSFVQSLHDSPENKKIVDAVLGLGKSLGILTTAEGIEDDATSEWLAGRGCTNGQGFLFGQPMPARDVAGHLQRGLQLDPADYPRPALQCGAA